MSLILPNVQQKIDSHIFDTLMSRYGNNAPGNDWNPQNLDREKNRYAIVREYRTIQPEELVKQLKGQTHSKLGVIVLGNTRVIHTPTDIMGKKYQSRLETTVYTCALNYRQSQIGGERIVYGMNADFGGALMEAPFEFNRLSLPFVLQSFESEFANDDLDIQRNIALIPTSALGLKSNN